jgi:hypothetical protein
MKKTTRRQKMNSDPARKPRLELARQTVRTLDADDLVRAAGGSGCDTSSVTLSVTLTSKK